MSTTQNIGQHSERTALEYLKNKGLRLLDNNFRCRFGEIDLIMNDDDTVVFIEVRCRNNTRFGSGADSVDYRKQQKIIASAQIYLQQHRQYTDKPCRFDVVSITHTKQGATGLATQHVDWITNAFQL